MQRQPGDLLKGLLKHERNDVRIAAAEDGRRQEAALRQRIDRPVAGQRRRGAAGCPVRARANRRQRRSRAESRRQCQRSANLPLRNARVVGQAEIRRMGCVAVAGREDSAPEFYEHFHCKKFPMWTMMAQVHAFETTRGCSFSKKFSRKPISASAPVVLPQSNLEDRSVRVS